jgi:hypothetical protein
MKNLILLALLLVAAMLPAQSQKSVFIMDFVKIKDNKRAEALFFYENNWKVYRDIALEEGYIKSLKTQQ